MDIIVSVVTGTYNRINYLKNLVTSVRNSIGIGIPYEIVVVDGGSYDGTIKWCKAQEDIVLIEQGKLYGAVYAFNAGFCAAKGKYVVIANDDIFFVDESIRCAVSLMEDDDSIGVGCFYQDRYNRPWHVEQMPAILNGKTVPTYYGQVCIVPRWLGDKVGWWGTEYHTYAGDNELSCNVLELGYKVVPVPCACIHDSVAQDELRKINYGSLELHPEGGHPDTNKWIAKWKRPNGLVGPIISNRRVVEPPQEYLSKNRKVRILYAPIYELGHEVQKRTKWGLRAALAKHHLVSEVDWVSNPWLIYDVAMAWKPDIIFTQFHDASIWKSESILELKQVVPHAFFVNWNGDYFPENFLSKEYLKMMALYNLCLFVTDDVKKVYNELGIRWKYWQIGWEKATAVPDASTPKHDVVFLGNGHYDFRIELGRTLRNLRGIDVGLYGSWSPEFKPNGRNLYDYNAGHKLYQNAKITISDGRPEASGFVSNRLFQAMYAGCFVLQQWFNNMTELNGLVDGEHLVVYKDTQELPELINYWLKNDKERNRIAAAGKEFALKHCSFDARVEELNKWLAEMM